MKSTARKATVLISMFVMVSAVQIATAAQPLLNLDAPAQSNRSPAVVYAPAEPPAASVPGTLYVPKGFERGLNEGDEAFVARMKVKQAEASQTQAALLREHAAAMQRIAQITGGRPRTAQDELAAASWQQSVRQEQVEAKTLRARRSGRGQVGAAER